MTAGAVLEPQRVAPTRDERSSVRRFHAAVAGLTAVQVLLRVWAVGGGWFLWDDYWWHDIVASHGLTESAGLTLGGHYSPLTYVPYYLLTAAFPYDWLSRVVVVVLSLLVIDAGVLAVARRLWWSRGAQLAAYTLWVFSSLAAPSLLWFSQFSMTGALLIASTWILWAYLRALSTRRAGPSVLAVSLLAVGMFTQERMLTMSVVLLLFVLWVCRTKRSLDLTRRVPLWISSGLVLLVWLMVYTSLPGEERASASLSAAGGIIEGLLRISAIPALLGGPWVLNEDAVLRRSAIPASLQVVAVGVLLVLIVWSRLLNPRAFRAWSVLGVGMLLDALLIVVGRGTTVAAFAVFDWRYFSGLAVIAPLLLVSSFVSPGTVLETSTPRRRLFALAIVCFVASSMITLVPLASRFHQNPARPYMLAALEQLSRAGPVTLMDRVLPPTVVNAELGPQRLASRVFSIWPSEVTFDAPTIRPLWLDDSGRLVPASLVQGRSSKAGECRYRVNGTDTTWIPLPGALNIYEWGVAVDYESEVSTRIAVTDGPRDVVVDLPAGRNSLYVPMPAPGERIGLSMLSHAESLCVNGVRSGLAGGPDEEGASDKEAAPGG